VVNEEIHQRHVIGLGPVDVEEVVDIAAEDQRAGLAGIEDTAGAPPPQVGSISLDRFSGQLRLPPLENPSRPGTPVMRLFRQL
jgi:hypothetical protein